MRPGFEIIVADDQCEIHQFAHENAVPAGPPLVTFAADADSRIEAAFIGELHYRDDLRRRAGLGDLPLDVTDAELALAVYRRRGFEGLRLMEGAFSLVVVDTARRRLTAMRDPVGSWPLFQQVRGGAFELGTSLLSLVRRRGGCEFDRDFIGSYLMVPFANVELADERTAFEGPQRVLAGSIVEFDFAGRELQRWQWDGLERSRVDGTVTYEDAVAQFAELLRGAVKERMHPGTTAAQLSGGMDSSAVVCQARELLAEGEVPGRLTTLSLSYPSYGLAGEWEYIQMVLDQGGPLEPLVVDETDALHFDWFTQGGVPAHDEPYAGLFELASQRKMFAAAAQTGATTVLTGVGAELLVENRRMYLADLLRRGRWITAVREARRWAGPASASLWSVVKEGGISPNVPAALRGGPGAVLRRGYGRWPDLDLYNIPPWVRRPFARKQGLWQKAREAAREMNRFPVERSSARIDLQLAAGDWPGWYVAAPRGLRISHPFLDSRLMTFCYTLPRDFKESPSQKKRLLQDALAGRLPEPIRTRRTKRGFNDVYWSGLRESLPRMEAMVQRSRLNELDVFDTDLFVSLLRQHVMGVGGAMTGGRLGRSLALVAWFDGVEDALTRPEPKTRVRHAALCEEAVPC